MWAFYYTNYTVVYCLLTHLTAYKYRVDDINKKKTYNFIIKLKKEDTITLHHTES